MKEFNALQLAPPFLPIAGTGSELFGLRSGSALEFRSRIGQGKTRLSGSKLLHKKSVKCDFQASGPCRAWLKIRPRLLGALVLSTESPALSPGLRDWA